MGSEMCIRDRPEDGHERLLGHLDGPEHLHALLAGLLRLEELPLCLLYTSDAADERSSVDLGGRRIIKKKTR